MEEVVDGELHDFSRIGEWDPHAGACGPRTGAWRLEWGIE